MAASAFVVVVVVMRWNSDGSRTMSYGGDDETSKGVGRRGKSEGTAEFALSFAEDGSGMDRELGRPASLFPSTATV